MSTAETVYLRRFRCPHCNRSWAKRPAAELHVERCSRNPAYRGCKKCACFQPEEPSEYETGYPGCDAGCDAGEDISSGLKHNCIQFEPRLHA